MNDTTINSLTSLHSKLIDTINTFPKEKANLIFYGDWTVKEVIGHISAWNKYFTQLLKSFSQDNPIDHWGSINQFNQKEVTKRLDHTIKQLTKELEESSQEFINSYKKLDQNRLSQKYLAQPQLHPPENPQDPNSPLPIPNQRNQKTQLTSYTPDVKFSRHLGFLQDLDSFSLRVN